VKESRADESPPLVGAGRIGGEWIAQSTLWLNESSVDSSWLGRHSSTEGVSNGLAVFDAWTVAGGSIALIFHSAGLGGGVSRNSGPSLPAFLARVACEEFNFQLQALALGWRGLSAACSRISWSSASRHGDGRPAR